jgi:hypothetical protein
MARKSFNGPSVERNEKFGALSNGTLMFPQDMERQFFPEAIKFSIFERDGASYSALKQRAKKTADTASESLKTIAAASKEELRARTAYSVMEDVVGENVKTEYMKSELANIAEAEGKRSKSIDDAKAAVENAFEATLNDIAELKGEASIEKHLQSIYLNMPGSVVFNESVGWAGADLGIVGALKSGNMGDAIESGLLSSAGAVIGGGVGALANMIPGISGIAAPIIGAALGGGGLQSGIESTFGVKSNPYKEQTFQGVDFRSFDFNFSFRARNDSDVYVIQEIIRSFRYHSKPTFHGESGSAGVFNYPKEFRIEFLTIDDDNAYETNEHLPEIKYCVCTAVNTNYTAQGWRTFVGGAPVEITLGLTFQETEIITGEDVMGETQVGRFKDSDRRF